MKNWPRFTFAALLCIALAWSVTPTQAAQPADRKALNPPTSASPHPVLSEVKVRKALAYCTDKPGLVKAAYPWLSATEAGALVMDTFLPKNHWAYDATAPNYAYDPSLGNSLLEEAGWTLAPGETYRKKDGKELALVGTTTDASIRLSWMAAWEEQLKLCGIHLIRNHQPTSWFFGNGTGLGVRDFEIGAFAWIYAEEQEVERFYSCDQIPTPLNNWQRANYSGWCNATVTDAIRQMNRSLIKAEDLAGLQAIQQQYAQDVPGVPLFQRLVFGAAKAGLTGVDFSDYSTPRYSYLQFVQNWQNPGKTTIVLGITQEPDSLFRYPSYDPPEIYRLINPSAYTFRNFDYQPFLLTQIPTLESGLAQIASVTVQTGDRVMLAAGYPTTSLQVGEQVRDENGNLVTFDGAPVQMKQLTVRYPFKSGIRWSDGKPLVKADFELAYNALCTSSEHYRDIKCPIINQVVFAEDNSGYTATWLPGEQSTSDYLPPFLWFPSHQEIATPGPYAGLHLSDVPYLEWRNLAEIAEHPLGVGPYQVTEWVKGDHMTLTAVDSYVNGAPLTDTLVIKFINPAQAETMLINGDVDILGPDTLREVSTALLDAQTQGLVKVYPILYAWEHADINLETYEVSAEVGPSLGGTLSYTNRLGSDVWVTIPAGAVAEPTTIEFRMTETPVNLHFMDPRDARIPFRISARQNGVPLSELSFDLPLQVTLHYNAFDQKFYIPFSRLQFYRINGNPWSDAALTCPVDQRRFEYNWYTGIIHLNVCQTGEYIALGDYQISLPSIQR